MLPLSRNIGTCHNNISTRHPERIRGLLVLDPTLHGNAELEHKVGAWSDAIGIELFAIGEGTIPSQDGGGQLLGLLGGTEATGTLLIHLGTGCDTVDGQVQDLARSYEAVEAAKIK